MTRDANDDDDWLEGASPRPRGGRGKATDALDADPTITDKTGLARFLGVAPKDVDRMLREGLPIRGERRRGVPAQFLVPACVQWMLARNGDTIEAAKRRQALAVARKREAEAGKLEDEFVRVEVVEATIRDSVAKFQAELESIPARLPAEVRDTVKTEIHAAINRLARAVQP
jgi:phage terminase Nu1 subunit (DNA packaging protein)